MDLPYCVYHDEPHVVALQEAILSQVLRYLQTKDELLLQLRISSATWGVDRFEQDYGILPSKQKPMSARIEGYRAKRRGRGTTDVATIEKVATLYSGYPCKAIEDYANYLFKLYFTMTNLPMPQSAEQLLQELNEIKPAHLGMAFFFKYTTSPATAYAGSMATLGNTVIVHPYHIGEHTARGDMAVRGFVKVGIRLGITAF